MTRTLRTIAHIYRQDPRDVKRMTLILAGVGFPLFAALAAITPN